jgi:hypothetical protein
MRQEDLFNLGVQDQQRSKTLLQGKKNQQNEELFFPKR